MKAFRVINTAARRSSISFGGTPSTCLRRNPVTSSVSTNFVREHASFAWIGLKSFPAFANCGSAASPFDREWSLLTARGSGVLPFPREIIWLGGAPGAGKGTNSASVASSRGITAPTIVVSSLLNSQECQTIKASGGMVDDAFVLGMLMKELRNPIYRTGVIVDGFPRTKAQVDYISELTQRLDACGHMLSNVFVMLHVSEKVSIERQLSRGENVRVINSVRAAANMPLLEARETDLSIDFARHRYRLFSEQLASLVDVGEHHPLVVVDAEGTFDLVKFRIHTQLAGKSTFLLAGVAPSLRFLKRPQRSQEQQLAVV